MRTSWYSIAFFQQERSVSSTCDLISSRMKAVIRLAKSISISVRKSAYAQFCGEFSQQLSGTLSVILAYVLGSFALCAASHFSHAVFASGKFFMKP